MKAANKSIFDKSYIIEAQAVKAAVKEFGEGWADGHKISFDEATKKFRVQSLKTPAQAVADLEHATHEVVAQMTAKQRAANGRRATDVLPLPAFDDDSDEARAIRASALEANLMQNVTLEQALKESGETIEELKEDQEVADKLANASMGVDEAKPRISSCERPTKRVWDIADSMPKASRKEVMAECVRQGIAYGTSRTQYQAWFKASQTGSKVDVRKPYQKGE